MSNIVSVVVFKKEFLWITTSLDSFLFSVFNV